MYQPEGIFHITGEPDTGKTILSLSAYHPKKTAYLFDDVKKPLINSNEFGLFVDLVAKYHKLKLLEFYNAIIKEISSIPDGKFDAIIFDTWSRTGKAIRYYAKANPYEFREASTFSKMGTIKGAEEWGETHNVEAKFISELSRKTKALFLITHIKPLHKAGVHTGTYIPDSGKSFDKVCNMRLWLRHNPSSGVPIALVLKRIAKIEVTKDGIKPVSVLPRKITPLPDENTVWQSINRYWDNPVGNREPTEDEIPTPFELSILDGILTDSQKEMWEAELREKERQEKEEKELFNLQWNEIATKARSLELPPHLAFVELKKEYPNLTIADVGEMLR